MSRQLDPPSKGDPGSLRLTSEMPAPTTAAGRALSAERDKRRPVSWERERILPSILAIEAEARAEVTDDMTTAYMVGFENGKTYKDDPAEARAPLDDHLTAREQHRLACGTCGKRLRDHIEGVTGHAFVRTFAPARAPLDVERLARALHNVSYGCEYPGRPSRADAIYHRGHGAAIAREYAALEEPTDD